MNVARPRPLAAREDRLVVRERMAHDGRALLPLDAASVDSAVAAIGERGIRTVAVGLLHADVDGSHERAIRDALARAFGGDIDVSISSEIDPQ